MIFLLGSFVVGASATILDIGQADIHNTLSLGILCKTEEQHSGFIIKKVVAANSQLSILNSELKKLNKSQHEANERLLQDVYKRQA